jgi:anti-anti-sigma factor
MTNATHTPPAVVPVRTRGVRETANRLATQLDGLGGAEARLDFGAVEYIESRELGALVVLNRKVRDAGGRLALVNVRPFVAGVLEVTRLDTILDVRRAA